VLFPRAIHSQRLPAEHLRRNVPVPPETQYEYVVATVDVKTQTLQLFLDGTQVDEYKYRLR